MLIFFVFVKLLSLMTNTRVGLAHTPKWPNCGSGNTCSHQRSDKRLWHFYRGYDESGGVKRTFVKEIITEAWLTVTLFIYKIFDL